MAAVAEERHDLLLGLELELIAEAIAQKHGKVLDTTCTPARPRVFKPAAAYRLCRLARALRAAGLGDRRRPHAARRSRRWLNRYRKHWYRPRLSYAGGGSGHQAAVAREAADQLQRQLRNNVWGDIGEVFVSV